MLSRGLIAAIAIVSVGAVAKQTIAPAPIVKPAPAVTPVPANFLAMKGYLPAGASPDSLALNPPPPAPGSGAEARDIEASKAGLALRGTPRWDLARRDADLFSPSATSTFSCAAGINLGAKTTPKIEQLMLRVARDLAMSTSATKRKYMRQRPFMVNGEPVCTPEHEKVLRSDGSYPSGHSAIGWGWGLILAEVIPGRTTQLVARGRAFGDSRRVCNVHWLVDVEEGRVDGSAVLARLASEPAFQADIAAARAEATALAGKSNPAGCEAEAAALAVQ